MTPLSDDQKKYAKYKWEFLRRNPEYIADHEKFLKKLRENDEEDHSDDQMRQEELKICNKWGLYFLLPPEMSFDYFAKIKSTGRDEIKRQLYKEYNIKLDDELVRFGYNRKFDPERIMFDILFPEDMTDRAFTVVDGWDMEILYEQGTRPPSDKLSESGKLTVEINLNFSKNTLIKEFQILINEWKNVYEEAHRQHLKYKFFKGKGGESLDTAQESFKKYYRQELKNRKKEYGKKYHFDNFDLYLQVYDLRQERKSWSEIMDKLNLNSIQTARNHYKAACNLVNKGIDLYVK